MMLRWWLVVAQFLVAAQSAYAFKIGTHVWVAQQVINNLHRCQDYADKTCIQIPNGDSFQVISIPHEVKEAILKYPEYYRMGHIGPDAFPDIVVGQGVIHPGVTRSTSGFNQATGFGTSQWLAHLLNKAEALNPGEEKEKILAFVYGFLGHAAADTFAHTYVNTYAGDVFNLEQNETAVELRHIALEDYIQQRTPDLEDHQGNQLGVASKLLFDGTTPAVPLEFVRLSLAFDRTAIDQLRATGAGAHLVAIYDLHAEIKRALVSLPSNMSNSDFAKSIAQSYFDSYYRESNSNESTRDEIFKIVKERYETEAPQGGSIQQAEIIAVQVLAYYYFKLKLNQQQAIKASELMNSFMSYQGKKADELQKSRAQIDGILISLANRASAQALNTLGQISDARQRLSKSLDSHLQRASALASATRNRERAHADLSAKKLTRLCDVVAESSCERVSNIVEQVPYPCQKCKKKIRGNCVLWVPDICHKEVSKIVKSLDPTCIAGRNSCLAARKAHDKSVADLQRGLNEADSKLNEARKLLAHDEELVKKEFELTRKAIESTVAAANSAVQTIQVLESNIATAAIALTKGHRNLITEWVSDIENASREFIKANGQAIIHSFDGKDETSTFSPLTDWMACYLPSVVGVPQEVLTASVCAAQDIKARYDAWIKDLEDSVRKIDPQVAGRLLDERDRFKKSLVFELATRAGAAFDRLTDGRYQAHMAAHVMMGKITSDELDEIFSKDPTSKNLLIFPKDGAGSISNRVNADMGVSGNEKFSLAFATALNATSFAALALADNQGINQLGPAGLMNFTLQSTHLKNLLTKSLRSIDGNHQWMEVAPPFPRRGGPLQDLLWKPSKENTANVDRRFLFEDGSKESGFPMFKWNQTRTNIFVKIFKGPLNPGLFQSEDFGFPNIVPDGYPYRPSFDVPFPRMD